jgi:hypothetical protein
MMATSPHSSPRSSIRRREAIDTCSQKSLPMLVSSMPSGATESKMVTGISWPTASSSGARSPAGSSKSMAMPSGRVAIELSSLVLLHDVGLLRRAVFDLDLRASLRLDCGSRLLGAIIHLVEPRMCDLRDDTAPKPPLLPDWNLSVADAPSGLDVPVVRHAEARHLGVWRGTQPLAEAARAGTATREELSGSTIAITALRCTHSNLGSLPTCVIGLPY